MKPPGGWSMFLFVGAALFVIDAFVEVSTDNALLGLVPIAAWLLGWFYGCWVGWESGWSAARRCDGRNVPTVVPEVDDTTSSWNGEHCELDH